jgi:hypothetical protein
MNFMGLLFGVGQWVTQILNPKKASEGIWDLNKQFQMEN